MVYNIFVLCRLLFYFDKNNDDVIIPGDENGLEIKFEQLAVLPIREECYVILKPLYLNDLFGDNVAIAFLLKTNELGKAYLESVGDKEIAKEILELY